MMKVLFPILIIILIGLIIGIIFFIKSVKENYDSENNGANILSLFFPIVGFIIYAVNIGKNNKIAKSCIRMAFLGMMIGVAIFVMTRLGLVLLYNTNVSHTKSRTMIEETNNNYDSLDSLKEALLNKEYLTDCNIKTTGRIVNINIEYTENDFYITNIIIENVIESYNLNPNYDYNININSKYIGKYSGKKGDNIIWTQNNE